MKLIIKTSLIIMLLFALFGCSSTATITPEKGIDETTKLTNSVLNTIEEGQFIFNNQKPALQIAVDLLPSVLNYIEVWSNKDELLLELKDLQDSEVLALADLAGNYSFTFDLVLIKDVLKIILYSIKTTVLYGSKQANIMLRKFPSERSITGKNLWIRAA